MTIDIFTANGAKKGTAELPAALFEAPIRMGLLHQAVMLQQSNRRSSIAHTKARGEIRGSTRKLFPQKGTGRARRGAVRSNVLKGGNKAFGPKSNANFIKNMPHEMRRAALLGSLSLQAKRKAIIGLENYPSTVKTKEAFALFKKLPVELGRRILVVLPAPHAGLALSTRNIPGVRTILAQYLNPEDVLNARQVIFLVEAIKKAEELFGKRKVRVTKKKEQSTVKERAPEEKVLKKPMKPKMPKSPKKTASKRQSSVSSASSASSDSSS